MTELPVIVVYCEGPKNEPHDRFIVAAYQRAHSNASVPTAWIPLPRWKGKRLRKVEKAAVDKRSNAKRVMWLRFNFACDRCEFDERRSWDDRNIDDKIYAVFDDRWTHGKNEISARELAAGVSN